MLTRVRHDGGARVANLPNYRALLRTRFDTYADEVFRVYLAKRCARDTPGYELVCTISVSHPKERLRANTFTGWIYPSWVAATFRKSGWGRTGCGGHEVGRNHERILGPNRGE